MTPLTHYEFLVTDTVDRLSEAFDSLVEVLEVSTVVRLYKPRRGP